MKDSRETDDRSDGKSFTCEQARAFGLDLAMTLQDEASIGDALLVFRALVYSSDRENLLRELEAGMMPIAPGFDRAVKELVTSRADEWDRIIPPKK